MKPFNKPLKYVTSTIMTSDTDANGNIIYYKPVKLHGKPVVLTIISRSNKDLALSRHPSYKLLVP